MKKIIIAAAIILTSGITAFCYTKTLGKPTSSNVKIESQRFLKTNAAQKADIQSAD